MGEDLVEKGNGARNIGCRSHNRDMMLWTRLCCLINWQWNFNWRVAGVAAAGVIVLEVGASSNGVETAK